MWTIVILFLITTACAFSQRCIEESFASVTITVYKNNSASTQEETVRGCITPQTVEDYNEQHFLGIRVARESIPNLKKGIVANFKGKFSITMEGNQIDTVKKEAFFNLPGVRSISLLSNKIKWVESGAFSNLQSLLYLNLEKNSIESFPPNTFSNLPKLERVDFSFNRLRFFKQEWFNNVPQLRVLEMAHNEIFEIRDESFSTLSSLKNLNLYGNRLKSLHPNAFAGLKELDLLNLANNDIKDINLNFGSLKKLLLLEIEGNDINYISEKVLDDLRVLSTLSIYANPIQCACFDILMKWSVRNRIHVRTQCNQQLPVCVDPITNPTKCHPRDSDDFYKSTPNFKDQLHMCRNSYQEFEINSNHFCDEERLLCVKESSFVSLDKIDDWIC
ncbi:hypothetical protein FQR65_LT03293 [Abscondita terminalis]|nr:hypothetical protein FQR65_LT03293 [Abscondita terminalis]